MVRNDSEILTILREKHKLMIELKTSVIIFQENVLYSKEIYTASKNFTLASAVPAVTNLTSALSTPGTRHQLVVIVNYTVSQSKYINIFMIIHSRSRKKELSTPGTRRPPEEQTDTSTSQTDSTLVAFR